MAVEHLHNCSAERIGEERVKEEFQGKTVWEGDVQIFALVGHPKTEFCYAWRYGDKADQQIATVLHVHPVVTPIDAVRAHIVGEYKKKSRK